jgi:hypothetical protein
MKHLKTALQFIIGTAMATAAGLFLIFAFCPVVKAEVTITPFFEAGAYHRDCNLTDRMICQNDAMGSDTPGTLGFGLHIDDCRWILGADECTLQWHHVSYVDRGWPFAKDEDEAQMDMRGMNFRWKLESLQFKLF